MRIPRSLSLTEVQAAFRDVQEGIKPLETGQIPLKGGRVTGAGKPVDSGDYVRKFDLEAAIKEIQKRLDGIDARLNELAWGRSIFGDPELGATRVFPRK